MEPREKLPLSELLKANQLCNRYEKDCQVASQAVPRIESYLTEFPPQYRMALVHELLLLEVDYRIRFGDAIDVRDYQDRFPELDANWLQSQIPVASHATPIDPKIPSRIGPYQIQEVIGEGAMGTVYRAVHQSMERTVAVIVLRAEFGSDPQWIERFEREVKTVAQLMHPNIITAYDARQERDSICLITEWIDGHDLESVITREGPLSPEEALDVILQTARGLEHAHQRGIIHRDIKPANLMRTKSGLIKILDLGLACLRDHASTPLTQTGMLLGTAGYMAPEQARNAKSASPRSDIYSLGCTLYFLINARPMYFQKSVANTVMAHANEAIPPLSASSNADPIHEDIEHVFQQMVAKQPTDRYASMSDVIKALKSIRRKGGKPAGSHHRHSNKFSRQTVLIVACGLLVGFVIWRFITKPDSVPVESKVTLSVGDNSTPPVNFELAFDGESSYVAVPNFRMDVSQPHTIEAVVIVDRFRTSNIVSYIGSEWMVLFMGGNQQWGVAHRMDGQSNLILSRQPVIISEHCHIAGVWDGQSLSLFINGEPAETTPISFDLPETTRGLFIGGIPSELLPDDQNDRYFAGRIDAVRISDSVRFRGRFQPPAQLDRDEQTRALFLFNEGQGTRTRNECDPRNAATLQNADWVGPVRAH